MSFFRNKLVIIILLAALTALTHSCGSKKSVQSQEQTASARQQYNELTENIKEWQSVEVPFSMSLTAPKRISLSGRAKIVRGQAMELSLRMLGIEVARLVADNDSVLALYRIDKVYLAESIKAITSVMPSSMANLQDLLTGRPFILGGSSLAPDQSGQVELSSELNILTVIPKKQPKKLSYGFTATSSPDVYLSHFAAMAPENEVTVTADYTPYQGQTPAGNVAETITLAIDGKTLDASAKLTWKWRSAKWNSKTEIDRSVPANYHKISGQSLLKSLQK